MKFRIIRGLFFFGLLYSPDWVHADLFPNQILSTARPPEWNTASQLAEAKITADCIPFNVPLSIMAYSGQSMLNGQFSVASMFTQASCRLGPSVSSETSCPPVNVTATNTTNFSCDNFDPTNPQAIDQILASYNPQMCAVQCNQGVIRARQEDLKCALNRAVGFQNKIGSLNNQMAANFNAAKKTMVAFKQEIANQTKAQANVNLWLNGDGKSPGLLDTQAKMAAWKQQFPQDIAAATKDMQNVQQAQAALESEKAIVTAGKFKQCFFDTPQPGLKCDANDTKPITYPEYVKCKQVRAGSMTTNSQGSQLDYNGVLSAQAQSQAANVMTSFDNIRANLPDVTDIAPTGDKVAAASQTPAMIQSASDVDRYFGSSLDGMFLVDPRTRAKTPLRGYLQSAFSYCATLARNQMSAQEKSASSNLSVRRLANKQLQQDTVAKMNQLLAGANQQYQMATAAMTRTPQALNISGCQAATMQTKVGCLQDIQNKVTAVVDGPATFPARPIYGTKPGVPVVTVNYTSLNDAVAQANNLNTQLDSSIGSLNNSKEAYATQFTTELNGFIKSTAAQLSTENAANVAKIDRLLQLAGLTPSPKVRGEPIQEVQGDIPADIKNIYNAIGGAMQPPAIDLATMPNVTSKFDTQLAQYAGQEAQLTSLMNQVKTMAQSCMRQELTGHYEGLQSMYTRLASVDCSAYTAEFQGVCGNQGDKLLNLMRTITPIRGYGPSFDSLRTGISSICNQTKTGQTVMNPGTKAECMEINTLASKLQTISSLQNSANASAGSANGGGYGTNPGYGAPGQFNRPGGFQPSRMPAFQPGRRAP